MGTNYYWFEKPPCPNCGRDFEPLHVGKSSAGWCFGLHVIPEKGINDLPDWERLWNVSGSIIKDEYGDVITPTEMKNIITERSYPKPPKDFNFKRNYAEPGPNNLVRHSLGHGCVKHGEGTWDCIDSDFS